MRDTVNAAEYYFRTRDNGATVFRISEGGRTKRLGMTQIAVVNVRNGEVRPQGTVELTDADRRAIADWMEERRTLLAAREADEVRLTIERLHKATQWVQNRATQAELDAIADDLLMAMHDMRTTIVKKRAEAGEK